MNHSLSRQPEFLHAGFGSFPIGTILPYSTSLDLNKEAIHTALEARGWMICDGRTLSAARYPELFAVLGYSYGGQDDLFLLPDYRSTLFLEVQNGMRPAIGENPEIAEGAIEGFMPGALKKPKNENINFIIHYTHQKAP